MTKMIQIRNVPDQTHGKLKTRAAKLGLSLSDYLLSEVEAIAEKPTLAELMERLAKNKRVTFDEPPHVTIRRLRDAAEPRDAD